jgi:hypothetical protein
MSSAETSRAATRWLRTARELIAAGRAGAGQLGMARELVRFERLTERLCAA